MATADLLALDVDEILFEFSEYDGFPRRALERAVANRTAVTPAFLEAIEIYLENPKLNEEEPALFFIVHLLAQFREKLAYPLLMRLFSLDSDRLHRILGDGTTETLPRIAISVFDGDPRPMQAVIENKEADEYARAGLFEALAFLVKEGRTDLVEFKRYLLRAYADLQPQGESHVWVGWQSAISMLGLTEYSGLVRKAFASGKIHPSKMRFRHFQADVRAAVTDPNSYLKSAGSPLGYIDDTIDELETWAAFADRPAVDLESAAGGFTFSDFLLDRPYVNPLRNFGRNDPCPCGSGKKFKKCCLE
jgi:hypothetical protein